MATTVYASAAAQRDDLRCRVGQGTNTTIISDAEADCALNAALRQLNSYQPAWEFDSFQTVANTQRYAVSSVAPASKIGRMQVFWDPAGGAGVCSTPGIFSSLGDLTDFVLLNVVGVGGTIPYIDETALELNARFNSVVKRFFRGSGWESDDGFVYLEPRPTAAGDSVYFYAPVPRFASPELVDTEWAEALMSYAEYMTFGYLAGKQSEIASASFANGKGVRTAGGSIYRQMRMESFQRFLDLVETPSSVDWI